MRKILTAQLTEQIHYSLKSRGLFLEEQKGSHKGSRVTAELFYIDQHILNEKTGRENLVMAWTESTKRWIINCLNMYKISHEVINFIGKTMKTWRVESTAEGRSLGEAKIQSSIFQWDALSPLLFIIALIPLNYILRKCTGGYKLSRLQEKINQLIYMDQTICKKWKRTRNSNTRS